MVELLITYNIYFITFDKLDLAAGLISNDFLIPLSPTIKGQTVDFNGSPIKKANSVKSLNIDTEELKKNNKKKYNGRPTSPVLNTRRMSNQYYYYYAINNPTNTIESNPSRNVYRRLPVYITPPLEHSSIIAVPKDIPKFSLNSPELSPIDLTKATEQSIILSTEDDVEGEVEVEEQDADNEENPIKDMSSLTLNSSFSGSEPSSSPPPNSYNYLKNYAIINNVDNIMKNQTYNNIVLDKDKSRSTMDMKTKTKLDSINRTTNKTKSQHHHLHAQFTLDDDNEKEEEDIVKNNKTSRIDKHKSLPSLNYSKYMIFNLFHF